ncbi:hypothetical protein PFAG_02437 [Plasmodium falciparum Santa Lucia]|uniref:Uncharacterized protein n=4 Tax=Plasmodium falciparum TaxID=5833 RepID=A0A024X8Y7_PLAFC|nr:hypothetical protein PFMALIP_05888 [Plasmodium falciparum MaliPS096_E11]ETW61663.1 hypothetical protein PFMC_02446 [Plasmodium falciparum CAMP/Malaysia]EUR72433.1 hypothetical protein PFBG_02527 [Plasmodium falciparum 7G8]EUT86568.1 hypothetical protein PFAG_02437 [Plasmodium falciparum Santa Lucia]
MSIVKIIFRRKKYIILQNSNIHFININQYKYNLSIKISIWNCAYYKYKRTKKEKNYIKRKF